MRIGVLISGESAQLQWAHQLGFRSVEWMRFDSGPCDISNRKWQPFAEQFAAEAKALDIRISAIGVYYRNPLDPRQTEFARASWQRAIEVAGHLGIRNICGFPGAIIETTIDERGGHPVYRPFENYIPQLLAFWEPIAKAAADRGLRIGFEHCPQGPYHLPLMNYNMLAQPAMWERLFDATRCENIGLEWDASHLVCQFIDPVANIHKFGSRIFHVHAKDAFINRPLLEQYGICHPGVAEHRFPGLGQSNWPEIVHALIRAGYDSDLNIEGHHDPVYRDRVEETGLLIAKRILEPLAPGEP